MYKGSDEVAAASADIASDGVYTLFRSSTSDTGSYTCTANVDSGGESEKSDSHSLNVVGEFIDQY